jgi:hypothetical protein
MSDSQIAAANAERYASYAAESQRNALDETDPTFRGWMMQNATHFTDIARAYHAQAASSSTRPADPFDGDNNALLTYATGVSPAALTTVEDAERLNEDEIPY